MENRNQGKSLPEYFSQHKYRKIGVYGAGDLGGLLYAELAGSVVETAYFIDRNAEGLGNVSGIPVITMDEVIEQDAVDAIVVTPIGEFDLIVQEFLRIAPEIAVISLYDAVYEL